MTNEAVVALRIAILFGIFFVIVMLLAVVVTKTDMGAKAKNWFLTINREVFWHP